MKYTADISLKAVIKISGSQNILTGLSRGLSSSLPREGVGEGLDFRSYTYLSLRKIRHYLQYNTSSVV